MSVLGLLIMLPAFAAGWLWQSIVVGFSAGREVRELQADEGAQRHKERQPTKGSKA